MKMIVKIAVVLSSITLMACEDTSNKSSQAASPTPTPAPTSTSAETANTESQKISEEKSREASELQCVRDLCGPESKYLATRAEGPFGELVPLDVKTFLNTDVSSRLTVSAEASLNGLRRKKTFLDEFIPTLQNEDVDQNKFALLLMRTLIVKLTPALEQAMEVKGGYSLVNFEKIPKELISTNPGLYQQAVYVLNVLRTSESMLLSAQLPSNFDDYKNKAIGNSRNASTAWSMHLNAKILQAGALEVKFGKYIFADIGSEVYAKAATGQVLSVREKNQFMALTQRITALNAFNEKNVKVGIENLQVDMPGLVRELQWDNVSAGITDFLAQQEQTKEFSTAVRASCNEVIVQAIAAAPSEFKLKRAQQLLDGVKVAAKKASASYFSGAPLTKAQAVIDAVKFEKPKTEDQVKRDIIADLEAIGVQTTDKMTMADKLNGTADKVSFLLLNIGHLLLPQKDYYNEAAKGLCDLLKPSIFEDQARKEGNDIIIRLGWQTASFHQIGAGIMAHEIGHAVSSTANILESSGQAYWKVRQCSSDVHKALREGKNVKGKESQFQEEDWADAFAVTTINILNKTWPYAENFGCGLVSMKDKQYKSNSLIDMNGVDIHSTGLLRAVQVHLGLGKTLPDSCKNHFGEKDTQTVSKMCSK